MEQILDLVVISKNSNPVLKSWLKECNHLTVDDDIDQIVCDTVDSIYQVIRAILVERVKTM